MTELNSPSPERAGSDSFFDALRERPEIQVAVAYVGGAWLFYDVADLLVFVLDLPDVILRLFVVVLGAGAVLALLAGRWMRLTLREIRRGLPIPGADIRGVPDLLEPALIRAAGVVSRRTVLIVSITSAVLFFLLFLFLWNSWASAHERQVTDSRITVAVFPFQVAGAGGGDAGGLGAALADLLTVTLDGTPGLRVVDPTSLWSSLESGPDDTPLPPDTDRARSLTAESGARRYVRGSVLQVGSRLEMGASVGNVENPNGAVASFRVSAHEDSVGSALERLAVDVVSAVWEREQLPTVPEIDRFATADAGALQAYLEAKGAMRQGRLEAAHEAVERAVSLDSTFALAHLEHSTIRSWLLFSRGEAFTGVRPILERAHRHGERLTPRNRMRIDAHLAVDNTDARTAAFLFERILSIDSLDVNALEGLAFTYLTYGWKIDRGEDEILDAYRRVLRADSSHTAALSTLARLEMSRGDLDAAGPWIDRLVREDTLGVYARGTRGSYEILRGAEDATAPALDSVLATRAQGPPSVVTTLFRDLRTVRPDLAERFLAELRADSMPTYHRSVALGALVQLQMARGRLSVLDSLLDAGELDELRIPLAGFQASAALAGVGDPDEAARSVGVLAEYAPIDSLAAYLDTRDVWLTGWAVGAHHATFGDTTTARRWQQGLAALPPGESTTVPEWPSSLSADIESRLAERSGDLESAKRWAQRAYDQWAIHGFNVSEHHPEPAMRFHLAELLRARGGTGSAERLYRSLCPPYTWMGFLTARASFELARILEERGETEEAAERYRAAATLWEGGDEAVVGPWLGEALSGLDRTGG